MKAEPQAASSSAAAPVDTRPRRQLFRCLDPLRVRWAEVDLQKIVFNGHYLMYFDTAVTAYWRKLAMPYHEAMHELQGDLYVRKATLEYEASARFDDQLHIGMRLMRMGKSSMAFQACAFKGERPLVHGELLYVFADPATQTSRPIPQALRDWMTAYEAGEDMVRVELGNWAQLEKPAMAIRTAVFIEEQGIAKDIECDGQDDAALHAVAWNRLGQAVGTARLLRQADGSARIGRMSVLSLVRGAGVGRSMLKALTQAASQQDIRELHLHAQSTVADFYRREGYAAVSEQPFEEAGIAHLHMKRRLGD